MGVLLGWLGYRARMDRELMSIRRPTGGLGGATYTSTGEDGGGDDIVLSIRRERESRRVRSREPTWSYPARWRWPRLAQESPSIRAALASRSLGFKMSRETGPATRRRHSPVPVFEAPAWYDEQGMPR